MLPKHTKIYRGNRQNLRLGEAIDNFYCIPNKWGNQWKYNKKLGELYMKLDLDNFGKRVSLCMQKCQYTNKTLTEELQLSKNAIGNYINNQVPNAKILFNLSQKFGVTMEYLLTGETSEIQISSKEKAILEHFSQLPEHLQNEYIQELKGAAKAYKSLSGKSSVSQIG